MSTPGARLSEIREAKLLSQAKVADIIGMSASQYNKYEKDKNNFTLGFRIKLANIFNEKELDYIQYGDNIPKAHSIVQSGSNNNQYVAGGNITNHGSDYGQMKGIDKEICDLLKKCDSLSVKEKILNVLKAFDPKF